MRWCALLVLAILGTSPLQAAEDEASATEKVVLGMVKAVNERDFDALGSFVASNVRRHSGATPGVRVESLADLKRFLRQDLAAVPDATQHVNLIFATGDLVAVHATYRGTQTGQMGPFPPSGKKVEQPFMGICRVEGGKIVEMWVEWDNLSILAQLGHFTPPAAPMGAAPSP